MSPNRVSRMAEVVKTLAQTDNRGQPYTDTLS